MAGKKLLGLAVMAAGFLLARSSGISLLDPMTLIGIGVFLLGLYLFL